MTTTSRVQLALNVSDIEAATAFYSKLFGTPPHKQRPGYANFAIADPPLKLVLFESDMSEGPLNHLGVELLAIDDVPRRQRELADRSLATRAVESELCCHALQDKVYVEAPDVPHGMWEFYAVVDDEPDRIEAPTTCCSPGGCC